MSFRQNKNEVEFTYLLPFSSKNALIETTVFSISPNLKNIVNKQQRLLRKYGAHRIKRKEKAIIICTENAKKLGGYRKSKSYDNHKTDLYIRRALRHETTHLVQSCNNNKPTGVIKNIEDKIHEAKLKALNSSVQISGNYYKELEAYVMEEKPRKVKEILKSYCL